MRKSFYFAVLALLTVLLAAPSFAQNVAYSGKLQIGFGDQDNTVATGARTNNAIPICAGNPAANPVSIAPAGTTLGTLIVNGRANQVGSGPGAALTFDAVSPTAGGAQEYDNSTCNVAIPGFANPRLRSRTQVGAAHWPGRKGDFFATIATAPTPATPTATYMVSAGGGNDFVGNTLTTSVPFFGIGQGSERIVKGPQVFGGGIPFSGGGGVQLGVNFATVTPGGQTLAPGDYGLVLYANGFLPTDPQVFGTDFKGVAILNGITPSIPTSYPAGLLVGRQDNQYAARTPGGTTRDQQGAIRTVGGGNTVTPFGTFMTMGLTADCVTGIPFPCPQIISPVAFSGVFFEWTTGTVTHTDQGGDFETIRTAMGFDVAVSPGMAVGGETRRLQLVSPWAASIRTVGPFGLGALLPSLEFGGVAIFNTNIIPVPEPGTLAMLGFGIAGLVGLGAARRRNR